MVARNADAEAVQGAATLAVRLAPRAFSEERRLVSGDGTTGVKPVVRRVALASLPDVASVAVREQHGPRGAADCFVGIVKTVVEIPLRGITRSHGSDD